MASSAVITIVAHTDQGLRLIPGMKTPSSRVCRDALREAFTPVGADPAIAEAFRLAADSADGEGFPIAMSAVFGPKSQGLDTAEITYDLPDLRAEIGDMVVTLGRLTADRPIDDVTLFVSYE
jgi:hypothetical protein